VNQANLGLYPSPVIATSLTVCFVTPRVTTDSARRRMVRVPLGISASLPSGRPASAATDTESASSVPLSGA
jgi:hypothetical protein